MLLNKQLKENDVISLKLVGGEEVVAKFVSMTADTVTVKKPLVLVQTQQGIGLVPYMISLPDDSEAHIDRSVVVMHTKARKEISDGYVQQTSGIMTASSDQIQSVQG